MDTSAYSFTPTFVVDTAQLGQDQHQAFINGLTPLIAAQIQFNISSVLSSLKSDALSNNTAGVHSYSTTLVFGTESIGALVQYTNVANSGADTIPGGATGAHIDATGLSVTATSGTPSGQVLYTAPSGDTGTIHDLQHLA